MASDHRAGGRPTSPLALVLGPVVAIVLVSVALSVVLVTRHVRQIRAGLVDRARTIAQFMTRDAVTGVLSYDHVTLRHLASLAVAQEDVVYATVHDADGEEMARRGETPPPAAALTATRTLDAKGLQLLAFPAGWEFRAPLQASLAGGRTQVGHIRLGISHATLDRERYMAVLTAVTFTAFVTLLAIVGAVVFMRRHLATLLAGAALAEEHERVADLKARILTQTSHEFRTPLAIIVSASDVLSRYGDRLSGEERAGRIEKIRAAVHQMTDLLDDVLLFGRTDASSFAPERTDLAALCRQAVDQARPLVPAGLELVAVLPGAPLPAAVDPFLLGHVLRGLIANAIRYSPDGGTITVRLEADQTRITLAVRDEGIGIPAADLPRLFEPFQRASNVGKIPGSGLGLAIAQRAIAVHGGRISAQSTAGVGSTFTITLPVTCLLPAERSAAA
jgi:signal transduction histidine kinase